MRVALETSPLRRPGGTRGLGRYTCACQSAAAEIADTVTEVSLSSRGPVRIAEFAELVERSARISRERFDLLHVTDPYATAVTARPVVTSVLDVIPLDIRSHRKTGAKARFIFWLASRSRTLLTISEFSARRISSVLGVPAERVFVAPLPPVRSFTLAQDTRAGTESAPPFALALIDMATPDPRKRAYWIPALAARLERQGMELWVAGSGTDREFAGVLNVKALGRVPDETLGQLYRDCVCFLYFSAYEGQGLPPLEAMAAGAPVVAMQNSAVTEVVSEGGVLVEEPGPEWAANIDPAPWMDRAMDEMVDSAGQLAGSESLRSAQRARGLEQAKRFGRAGFVDGVRAAYEAAL